MGSGTDTERFDGWIAGVGTAAGLRVVVGHWPRSPYGAFTDVMVERPDGHRVLLAPDQRVAEFVGGARDLHRIVAADVRWEGREQGGLARVDPPVRFGFGSTPSAPSLVRITTLVRHGRHAAGRS